MINVEYAGPTPRAICRADGALTTLLQQKLVELILSDPIHSSQVTVSTPLLLLGILPVTMVPVELTIMNTTIFDVGVVILPTLPAALLGMGLIVRTLSCQIILSGNFGF